MTNSAHTNTPAQQVVIFPITPNSISCPIGCTHAMPTSPTYLAFARAHHDAMETDLESKREPKTPTTETRFAKPAFKVCSWLSMKRPCWNVPNLTYLCPSRKNFELLEDYY